MARGLACNTAWLILWRVTWVACSACAPHSATESLLSLSSSLPDCVASEMTPLHKKVKYNRLTETDELYEAKDTAH